MRALLVAISCFVSAFGESAFDSTKKCSAEDSEQSSLLQTFTSSAQTHENQLSPPDPLEEDDTDEDSSGKQFLFEFRWFAKADCAEDFAACESDVDCKKALFNMKAFVMSSGKPGRLSKLLSCVEAAHQDNSTTESLIQNHETESLGEEPSFGKNVGIGAVGGVAGNLATAGLSTATGLVWDGIAKIPGGEQVAEVGRTITCAFGMGCDSGPSNEEVIGTVKQVGEDLKREMHQIKDELTDEIQAVGSAVVEMKSAVLNEMSSMGRTIEDKIGQSKDEIIRVMTTLTSEQTQKLQYSIGELKNLVHDKLNALDALAKRHHFESQTTICNLQASKITARYKTWKDNIDNAETRTVHAKLATNSADKITHLQVAAGIMSGFWSEEANKQTSIRQDIETLENCLTDNNIFNNLASVLKTKSMSPDAKLASMSALFSRYLAVLAEADAIYTAYLFNWQLKQKIPLLITVVRQVAKTQLRRAKVHAAFYNALNNNNLISNSCPRCDIRAISRGWRGYKQLIAGGYGSGCNDVNAFARKYESITNYFGEYNKGIAAHAKPFRGSSGVCKIYARTVNAWRGGCYGDMAWPRALEYFVDERKQYTYMYCSGW